MWQTLRDMTAVETERISNAIVVHGPGRSGTTLFYNILALHPSLAWVSGYVDRFPRRPSLALLNRLNDIPLLERWSRGRGKWPRPAEAYGFWNAYFPDFSDPDNRQTPSPADSPESCVATIHSMMTYTAKPRFVTKITGHARAQELDRVFEDPYIVYIQRDPRAVVMSYYKQRWGYKRQPSQFAKKSTRTLLKEYVQRYQAYSRESRRLHRFNYRDVRYEDVVARPAETLAAVLAHTDLPPDERFDELVDSWSLQRGTNQAWRKQLADDDADYLDALLAEECARLGYGTANRQTGEGDVLGA